MDIIISFKNYSKKTIGFSSYGVDYAANGLCYSDDAPYNIQAGRLIARVMALFQAVCFRL